MSDKIPVYVINGFLEGGKTKFINFTVGQDYFAIEGRTLIVACEEGVEEYDKAYLDKNRCDLVYIEEEEDFSVETLGSLVNKYNPDRIIIEYNGFWDMARIAAPEGCAMEQQISIIDGTTLDMYFSNGDMRSKIMNMVRDSELVLVNRGDKVADPSATRRALKSLAMSGEVVFETSDGEEMDFSAEDLPFDFEAPVIEIGEDDYDKWFFDAIEHRERYDGKTVRFKAQVFKSSRFLKKTFVPGRKAMVCCANDISFLGFTCKYRYLDSLSNKQWIMLEAKVGYAYQAQFRGVGPVLEAISVRDTEPAKKEVLGT